MVTSVKEQNEVIKKLEEKLNAGHDSNYESYTVWRCWDGMTDIRYSNIDNSKCYKINTDDIDTVVAIFAEGKSEEFCTSSCHYDLD